MPISNVNSAQIAALVKLQQIELDSVRIELKLNNVDQRITALDNRLQDYKQVIEEQQSVIQDLNEKYRAYETDVRVNLDKIKKSEAKLRSVKTNKEYQSSLKEIDDLKTKNSSLEDEMIELLDRLEEAENALQIKQNQYADLEIQLKNEKEVIIKETEEGKQQLKILEAEWKTLSDDIDAELLSTFNKVKSNQSNAIGIVAVIDAVCQGCHMNIPPQMYNELQRGDNLKKCPICDRIIYWQDDNKRSE